MNDERFEASLRQAKIRPVPADWRADVLAAARAAEEGSSAEARRLEPSALPWGGWLWFRRLAWGGLAGKQDFGLPEPAWDWFGARNGREYWPLASGGLDLSEKCSKLDDPRNSGQNTAPGSRPG